MDYSRKWEQIDGETARLKTPEGWIVSTETFNPSNSSVSITMCFVPDKDSAWELKEEKPNENH